MKNVERRNQKLVELTEVIKGDFDDDTVMRREAVPEFKKRIKAAHEVGQIGFVMARVTPKERTKPVLFEIENTIRKEDPCCIALPGSILILLTRMHEEATVAAVINRLRLATSHGLNAKVRYSGLFIPYPTMEYHKIITQLENQLLAEYESEIDIRNQKK